MNSITSRIEWRAIMTNKDLVLRYLDIVFNQRNLEKAEMYWKGDMIQHNPHMPNGLDVLRGFITSSDPAPSYQAGLASEVDNYVMVHGKYTGWQGKNMIAVDIFRVDSGKIVEHWDVMQEEVSAENSINSNSMFPIQS